MPRNASGTYTLPSGNPVVSGTLIDATWANNTLSDLGNEVTDSLSRSGEGAMLAPLRITDGVQATPSLAFSNEPSSGLYRAGSNEWWAVAAGVQNLRFTNTGLTTRAAAGAVGTPSLAAFNDTDTGIYFPGANELAIATGGAARMTFDSAGAVAVPGTFSVTGNFAVDTSTLFVDAAGNNVGIGTASPGSKLDVAGGIRATTFQTNTFAINANPLTGSSTAAQQLRFQTTGADFYFGVESSTAGSFFPGSTAYAGVLFNAASTPMQFYTAGTLRATLTAGGDFGIGTASPSSKLTIAGNSSANTIPDIQITRSSSGTTIQAGPNITFADGTTNNTTTLQVTQGRFGVWNYGAGVWNERLSVDSSGNLGIGTSSPGAYLSGTAKLVAYANANAPNSILVRNDNAGSSASCAIALNASGNTWGIEIGSTAKNNNALTFQLDYGGANSTQMILTSSGQLGIGTTSPTQKLEVVGGIASTGTDAFFAQRALVPSGLDIGAPALSWRFYTTGTTYTTGAMIQGLSAAAWSSTSAPMNMVFYTVPSGSTTLVDRGRFTEAGSFLVGQTTQSDSGAGFYVDRFGSGYFGVSGGTPLIVNRNTNDGTLILFRQDGNDEGSISVSGNTVSYNAFAGSHWSQLQDGSKPDILRGTVMESINELCVWPDENNERLPKSKISDTAGSKKVYGVFMAWDNDWTETNDMYVTAVGAFICRINGSVTVQEGDLLESNGDGTARVQADDIIRSSTIGKVTSTVKTHQYADGSYCVPTVLYCG